MRSPAKSIADYYRKNELLDEDAIQKMVYTLKTICNELSKFLIFLILFSLLGKRNYFLLCYFALVSLRFFAGGIHCKTYFGCFTFSLSSFMLFIYIPVCFDIDIFVLQLIAYLSCIAPALLSPILPIFRRIKVRRNRIILKVTAVVMSLLWTSLCCTVIDEKYSVCILLAIVTTNIQLTIPKIRDVFYRKEKSK